MLYPLAIPPLDDLLCSLRPEEAPNVGLAGFHDERTSPSFATLINFVTPAKKRAKLNDFVMSAQVSSSSHQREAVLGVIQEKILTRCSRAGVAREVRRVCPDNLDPRSLARALRCWITASDGDLLKMAKEIIGSGLSVAQFANDVASYQKAPPQEAAVPPTVRENNVKHNVKTTMRRLEPALVLGGLTSNLAVAEEMLVYGVGRCVVCQGDGQRIFTQSLKVDAVATRGQQCASADGEGIQIWSMTTLKTKVIGRGLFQKVVGLGFVGDFDIVAAGRPADDVMAKTRALVAMFRGDDLIGEETTPIDGELKAVLVEETAVVTAGDGHVAFWTTKPRFKGNVGLLGSGVPEPRSHLSIAMTKNATFTGGDNGKIYVWRDARCLAALRGHSSPVRSLVTLGQELVSADDQKLRLWGPNLAKKSDIDLRKTTALAVRQGRIIAAGSSFYEVDMEKKTWLSGGHAGSVTGIAAHPKDSRVFASVGLDKRLLVWRVDGDIQRRVATLDSEATAVAFSFKAQLVVGLQSGSLVFFAVQNDAPRRLRERRQGSSPVTALVYSTEGTLAAATKAGDVYVFCNDAVAPQHVLRGHNGLTITKLDFFTSDTTKKTILRTVDESGTTNDWHIRGPTDKDAIWLSSSFLSSDDVVTRAHHTDLFAISSNNTNLRVVSDLDLSPEEEEEEEDMNTIHETTIGGLAFLADDLHVVSYGVDDRALVIWKLSQH